MKTKTFSEIGTQEHNTQENKIIENRAWHFDG